MPTPMKHPLSPSRLRRSLAGLSLAIALARPPIVHAFPMPKQAPPALGSSLEFAGNYDFEGIVRLSNCSGSLVQFEGARDDDPALVLTNGHCVRLLKPGESVVRQPSTRSVILLNATRRGVTLQTSELVYATMTDTDIAVYKLRASYAEIKARYGISPFALDRRHPKAGTAIQIVSGYWARGYSCQIEAFSFRLREDKWTFKDSARYSRPGCDVIGGTSGSPVIANGTRTVVAVNNTINENGERCAMDNPCEVDESGNVTYQKGYGYAQQTYLLYSCLDANQQLDIDAPGCLLPHSPALARAPLLN